MRRLFILGGLVLLAGGLGAGLAYFTGWSPFPSSQAQEGSVCEKALAWFKKACERDEAAALAEGGTFSVAASTWHQHRTYPVAGVGVEKGEVKIYAHPRYGYVGEVFLEPEASRQVRATGTVEPIVVRLTADDVKLLELDKPEKVLVITAWMDKVRKGQVPQTSHEEMCREIAC